MWLFAYGFSVSCKYDHICESIYLYLEYAGPPQL